MRKLTKIQAGIIRDKLAKIGDLQNDIRKMLISHEIINKDEEISEEIGEDVRDAIEMLVYDASADYLWEKLEEITK